MTCSEPLHSTIQNRCQPQTIFGILGVFFGLLFTLITPPFQVPDEIAHFYRAYQVSEGVIKGIRQNNRCGGILPENLEVISTQISRDIAFHPENKQEISDLCDGFRVPLDRDRKNFIPFVNTAIHTPLVYLPQAAGIRLGWMLSNSPLCLVYFGRLANLTVWLVLVYHAIRIIPVFKNAFLILALMPMSLFQAASLSADSMTNALSFLWVSMCVNFMVRKGERIQKRELLYLFLLSVMVSLSKQVYFVLVFLVFLLDSDSFGGKRNKWLTCILLVVLSLVCSAGWMCYIQDIYVPFRNTINTREQIDFILSNPIQFIGILSGTIMQQWCNLMLHIIGILGWLDTYLMRWQYWYYPVVLLAAVWMEPERNISLSLQNRLLLLFVVLSGVVLIAISQYLSWTPPRAGIIEGLQGRYFIPLSPVLLLLFYCRKTVPANAKVCWNSWVKSGFYVSNAVSLFCTIVVLLKRYWLE